MSFPEEAEMQATMALSFKWLRAQGRTRKVFQVVPIRDKVCLETVSKLVNPNSGMSVTLRQWDVGLTIFCPYYRMQLFDSIKGQECNIS